MRTTPVVPLLPSPLVDDATKVQGDASIWLPHDVIADILSRLPLKSLCRFRCVSTWWRAIIADPAFVSEHSSRAEPLIVASSFLKSSVRLFDMEGNIVRVIRGVGSFTNSICSRADDLACVILAPGKAKVVDLATGEVLVTYSEEGRALGFGRAVPSGLYKLVWFRSCKCEILTVGDHVGWRNKYRCSSTIANYSDTITINGVVYLFIQAYEVSIILRFDLESEEWRKRIKGPPISEKRCIKVILGELSGSLCVAATDLYKTGGEWEIWLLADSVDSIWVKAYSISSAHSELTPLKVLPDSNKLFFYSIRGALPRLQIYDPDDGTCTEVAKMPIDYTSKISLCSLRLERFVGGKI